jgi:hypothetical protein
MPMGLHDFGSSVGPDMRASSVACVRQSVGLTCNFQQKRHRSGSKNDNHGDMDIFTINTVRTRVTTSLTLRILDLMSCRNSTGILNASGVVGGRRSHSDSRWCARNASGPAQEPKSFAEKCPGMPYCRCPVEGTFTNQFLGLFHSTWSGSLTKRSLYPATKLLALGTLLRSIKSLDIPS